MSDLNAEAFEPGTSSPDNSGDANRTNAMPRVLPARTLKAKNRFHSIALHLLPALGTLVAVAILPWYAPNLYHIVLALIGWFVTASSISVGYHRLFTHRSFEAHRYLRWILALFGSLAGQGPISFWVANHRRHHENSDHEGDPHSPLTSGESRLRRTQGLWHAHIGWTANDEVPNPLVYAPDISKDRALSFCSRHYLAISAIGNLLPVAIVAAVTHSVSQTVLTFLWVVAVRLFVTLQMTFAVNSICHMYGFQSYPTDDCSTNNIWLAIPTVGEAWHNNHHAYPTSARFGLKWWQIDIGYVLICVLMKLGLVYSLNEPKQSRTQEVQ